MYTYFYLLRGRSPRVFHSELKLAESSPQYKKGTAIFMTTVQVQTSDRFAVCFQAVRMCFWTKKKHYWDSDYHASPQNSSTGFAKLYCGMKNKRSSNG